MATYILEKQDFERHLGSKTFTFCKLHTTWDRRDNQSISELWKEHVNPHFNDFRHSELKTAFVALQPVFRCVSFCMRVELSQEEMDHLFRLIELANSGKGSL
ncbi:hypothetical protein SHAb15599_00137 [Acinetobacter phage SH-Ab 15599]|nr:hypothetical protein SHAb15599_00137 [Acinetobacter phage SH-Ab 15599]